MRVYMALNSNISICHLNGLVRDCSNSIANALKVLQSCTKPLICSNSIFAVMMNIFLCWGLMIGQQLSISTKVWLFATITAVTLNWLKQHTHNGFVNEKEQTPKVSLMRCGGGINTGLVATRRQGTSSIKDWQETKWHCSFSNTVLALYFYTIYLLIFWIVNDKVSKCSAQCISFLNHRYAGTINSVYNTKTHENIINTGMKMAIFCTKIII